MKIVSQNSHGNMSSLLVFTLYELIRPFQLIIYFNFKQYEAFLIVNVGEVKRENDSLIEMHYNLMNERHSGLYGFIFLFIIID